MKSTVVCDTAESPSPFSLNAPASLRFAGNIIESLSGLKKLADLYALNQHPNDVDGFLDYVLKTLDIKIQYREQELSHIPSEGPCVIVANHPFGCLEGVFLAKLLRQVRPDTKLMANYLLARIPEISELFISVDPFGGKSSVQNNRRPLKDALTWLKNGGCLVVFPAGEVSHFQFSNRRIEDPAWQSNIGRIIQSTKASVVPAYFGGNNSLGFQLAGMIHPRLRTMLLPRQLTNKSEYPIELKIGRVIGQNRLRHFDDERDLMNYLRLNTYVLAKKSELKSVVHTDENNSGLVANMEPIASSVSPGLLDAEIAQLPADRLLCESGGIQVLYACADEIPWCLQEIGRLRELTFRQVGEGTGRTRDIDLYDSYYTHLFLWQSEKQEIVGAYRLGLADEILKKLGKKGLYTFSLFSYRTALLDQINPAIELGRSFVRPEYQKSFSPLMLLWKGIGGFVAQHPHYRILFGPVSISNEYTSTSQQLMIDFLRINNYGKDLARLVKPRNPIRPLRNQKLDTKIIDKIGDVDAMSALLAQVEADQKGMPILLKQYLNLGGQLIGFNRDADFSDVIDGLILVDLTQTDTRVLKKYMGSEAAATFLKHHMPEQTQSA